MSKALPVYDGKLLRFEGSFAYREMVEVVTIFCAMTIARKTAISIVAVENAQYNVAIYCDMADIDMLDHTFFVGEMSKSGWSDRFVRCY